LCLEKIYNPRTKKKKAKNAKAKPNMTQKRREKVPISGKERCLNMKAVGGKQGSTWVSTSAKGFSPASCKNDVERWGRKDAGKSNRPERYKRGGLRKEGGPKTKLRTAEAGNKEKIKAGGTSGKKQRGLGWSTKRGKRCKKEETDIKGQLVSYPERMRTRKR